MEKILLHFILLFVQWLRLLLLPFLYIMRPYISFLQSRYEFESKNYEDSFARSFKEDQLQADFLFEVASEGELEQVLPIITILAEQGRYIELVYASRSVETKIDHLVKTYPDKIRRYRLNLVFIRGFFKGSFNANFLKWVSATDVILCRYDFYPEFFMIRLKRDINFFLLSATLKNKKSSPPNFIKKLLYKQFHKIILASPKGREDFGFLEGHIFQSLRVFDFRIQRLLWRKINRNEYINLQGEACQQLWENVQQSPFKKKLILGSFWENESRIFNDQSFIEDIKSKEVLVCLAPHLLSKNEVQKISGQIKLVASQFGDDLPVYLIEKSMKRAQVESLFRQMNFAPGVLISLVPGVLVEFYSLFDFSFIGGGHGRSVHSLLEPYIMNNTIFCGPKTYRSTEFDFVNFNSPKHLYVVKELDQFYSLIKSIEVIDELEVLKREKLTENSKIEFKDIMKEYFNATV